MKTKTKNKKNLKIQMMTRKDYLENYKRKTKSGGERKKENVTEEEEEEKVEEKEEFMFCYVWIITFMRAFHNMLLYISNDPFYFSSFV